MPTPSDILDMTASLQNDTRKAVYTHKAMLPYFNMALRAIQEEFELNNIPATDETSAVLAVPVGTSRIAISGTTPVYPSDLIEIRNLYESPTGENSFVPMRPVSFLPQIFVDSPPVNQFLVFAWNDNEIKLIAASSIIDLRIEYIKSLFPTITDDNFDNDLGAKYKTIFNYLGFKTAAYCSMFIGENPDRAIALNDEANGSLQKSLGISVKGQQNLGGVRRRPFMESFKMRNKY